MVNGAVTLAREAERRLAIGYAPGAARPVLAALLALDARLGAVVAATREPMVGQMRLTWWHDALSRLDAAPPPAEPVLAALAAAVLPAGIGGAELATTIGGWEALLEAEIDEAAMLDHARARGGVLFALAGRAIAPVEPVPVEAGEGWALADLSLRLADPVARAGAAALAGPRLDAALRRRWPPATRALGALLLLARADLAGTPPGAPRRVGRLAWHRLTGR